MKKSVQLIALVAVALLSSCSGGEKDKATAEKVDEKPRVKLASVTARPVDQIQEYTATVQAEVKNNIAPSSPVRIDQIFVEVGDRVSKGQKLVQMDAANLKQAKFRLDNQEIEFKRTDELYIRWAVLPNQNGMRPKWHWTYRRQRIRICWKILRCSAPSMVW